LKKLKCPLSLINLFWLRMKKVNNEEEKKGEEEEQRKRGQYKTFI
jgi:hypothetical protein